MADETPRSSLPVAPNLPQPRDVAVPDFTSNTYVPFAGNMTGDISVDANLKTIWAPREARFVLRGGYILVTCQVATAGTGTASTLSLYDEGHSNIVLPLGMYLGTGTLVGDLVCGAFPAGSNIAGTRITAVPFRFDLGKGYRSLVKNNRLRIGGDRDIAGGSLRYVGLFWGVQE